MAEERKSPLQQAIDLLVYAPLGLAYTAMDELPTMVEKGRQRFGNQVMVARMIGQFAVTQGQKEAEKAAGRLAEQAGTVASRLGGFPGVPGPTAGATGAARSAASAVAESGPASAATNGHGSNGSAPRAARSTAGSRRASEPAAAGASGASSGGAAGASGSADELAIPGYDSLSASQVVQRLAGLAEPELEAVRRYEQSNRGRRTILSKVDQLESDRR